MEYTVSKLAKISGVTQRTLHYYDQIGLLKPASVSSSGYRLYGKEEVDMLQQIIFYRELVVSIEEIKTIIQEPTFNQTRALEQHLHNLKRKRARLDQIIATVEKTIANSKGEIVMQDKEKFEGFKAQVLQDNEQKYGDEIREIYGDKAINQSNQAFKNMTEAEYNEWRQLEDEITDLLPVAFQTEDPSSEIAQTLAAKHKAWLMYMWPSYSEQAHAVLADMYVTDERFSAYYDKHVEGGAQFLRDAIFIFTGEQES
ncbi:MerR family transcriptional regulator [Staphylococcus edaphicus]|uniref:MerR family transcriptional regulator n=1 Tax=Staphylococcus edaphicus TaxID=1955013 RepID=A0A2C6VIJ4_9STAP|nr:MerR family transcriptional regulator [Staphylococcus edaphicus]PHK50051.1 MerR family transcriptional regulator [Staphylococcus edaphicus]UQW81544.1 MerR family transcriptional regulator [Staphylococcus edaphicus]